MDRFGNLVIWNVNQFEPRIQFVSQGVCLKHKNSKALQQKYRIKSVIKFLIQFVAFG